MLNTPGKPCENEIASTDRAELTAAALRAVALCKIRVMSYMRALILGATSQAGHSATSGLFPYTIEGSEQYLAALMRDHPSQVENALNALRLDNPILQNDELEVICLAADIRIGTGFEVAAVDDRVLRGLAVVQPAWRSCMVVEQLDTWETHPQSARDTEISRQNTGRLRALQTLVNGTATAQSALIHHRQTLERRRAEAGPDALRQRWIILSATLQKWQTELAEAQGPGQEQRREMLIQAAKELYTSTCYDVAILQVRSATLGHLTDLHAFHQLQAVDKLAAFIRNPDRRYVVPAPTMVELRCHVVGLIKHLRAFLTQQLQDGLTGAFYISTEREKVVLSAAETNDLITPLCDHAMDWLEPYLKTLAAPNYAECRRAEVNSRLTALLDRIRYQLPGANSVHAHTYDLNRSWPGTITDEMLRTSLEHSSLQRRRATLMTRQITRPSRARLARLVELAPTQPVEGVRINNFVQLLSLHGITHITEQDLDVLQAATRSEDIHHYKALRTLQALRQLERTRSLAHSRQLVDPPESMRSSLPTHVLRTYLAEAVARGDIAQLDDLEALDVLRQWEGVESLTDIEGRPGIDDLVELGATEEITPLHGLDTLRQLQIVMELRQRCTNGLASEHYGLILHSVICCANRAGVDEVALLSLCQRLIIQGAQVDHQIHGVSTLAHAYNRLELIDQGLDAGAIDARWYLFLTLRSIQALCEPGSAWLTRCATSILGIVARRSGVELAVYQQRDGELLHALLRHLVLAVYMGQQNLGDLRQSPQFLQILTMWQHLGSLHRTQQIPEGAKHNIQLTGRRGLNKYIFTATRLIFSQPEFRAATTERQRVMAVGAGNRKERLGIQEQINYRMAISEQELHAERAARQAAEERNAELTARRAAAEAEAAIKSARAEELEVEKAQLTGEVRRLTKVKERLMRENRILITTKRAIARNNRILRQQREAQGVSVVGGGTESSVPDTRLLARGADAASETSEQPGLGQSSAAGLE